MISTIRARPALLIAIVAMIAVIATANKLALFPVYTFGLQDYVTWGTIVYVATFLVVDVTNRLFGAQNARFVVYVSFPPAILIAIYLATPRIAIASLSAFLSAQLLDIFIFDKMRQKKTWWLAPFISTNVSSLVDTWVFFPIAFVGAVGVATYDLGIFEVEAPVWVAWGCFDLVLKALLSLVYLVPYRMLTRGRARFLPRAV